LEGSLAKVYEGHGDGVAAFKALGVSSTLGSSGSALKSSYFKIPLLKPRGCRVTVGLFSISISTPYTLRIPFRWRLELEGLTISREAKPQFTVQLEDSLFHKILFDVKPVLSTKGEGSAVESYTLRATYDSAHPIVVRELSLFKVYTRPRLEHSATYMTGALTLDPGDTYTVTLSTPEPVGGDRVLTLTMITPSPRVTLNVVTGDDVVEVSGQGFKVVELQPQRPGAVKVTIEYPRPEISIYPKKVVVTSMVLVENKTPIPPLSVQPEKVEVEGGRLRVKLSVANEGEEVAEDVHVTLRHAMINLKEARLGLIEPGGRADVTLEADTSKLPARTQRLLVVVTWSKDGIASSKTITLNLKQP
jgi:hypothetical protein